MPSTTPLLAALLAALPLAAGTPESSIQLTMPALTAALEPGQGIYILEADDLTLSVRRTATRLSASVILDGEQEGKYYLANDPYAQGLARAFPGLLDFFREHPKRQEAIATVLAKLAKDITGSIRTRMYGTDGEFTAMVDAQEDLLGLLKAVTQKEEKKAL